MDLILLSKDRGQVGHWHLAQPRVWLAGVLAALPLVSAVFFAGFQAATYFGVTQPDAEVSAWRAELAEQEALIAEARRKSQESLDALALRLGQMNARVIRLDALGRRLTQMADLQDGEFDFDSPPSMGGPEEPLVIADSLQLPNLLYAFDSLDEQVVDRQQKLDILEDFLLNRKLRQEVEPEGRPVTQGYISSFFGKRTDPFTGRPAFHKGVDFAGKHGAEVVAVASGVVIWSGPRYGYGQLVEVNHGNGYVTRYAHNEDNLVAVGDTVKKGQIIARMGATGRATGPNLHFEVLRNGKVVNPLSYIKAGG
jgi:murein DD-endopeptidase MepM/ murein hydrolase activator NlpD